MDDFTFKPIHAVLAEHLFLKAQPILDVQYPRAEHASMKHIAQTGVYDFIQTGEPVAHTKISPQDNARHLPLRRYIIDVGTEHEQLRIINSPNNLELDDQNQRQHFSAGRLAASAALLLMRDKTYKPTILEGLLAFSQVASTCASTSKPGAQPTSSSKGFSRIDGSGLIAPRP